MFLSDRYLYISSETSIQYYVPKVRDKSFWVDLWWCFCVNPLGNQYLFTTSEITANELLVVVIGDIAGVLVAIVGIVMLAFGIHYTLRSRNENNPRT